MGRTRYRGNEITDMDTEELIQVALMYVQEAYDELPKKSIDGYESAPVLRRLETVMDVLREALE